MSSRLAMSLIRSRANPRSRTTSHVTARISSRRASPFGRFTIDATPIGDQHVFQRVHPRLVVRRLVGALRDRGDEVRAKVFPAVPGRVEVRGDHAERTALPRCFEHELAVRRGAPRSGDRRAIIARRRSCGRGSRARPARPRRGRRRLGRKGQDEIADLGARVPHRAPRRRRRAPCRTRPGPPAARARHASGTRGSCTSAAAGRAPATGSTSTACTRRRCGRSAVFSSATMCSPSAPPNPSSAIAAVASSSSRAR